MAHILLVDDDDSLRSFIKIALEKDGYDVTDRPDGLSAWSALQSDDHYDLLLTDIVMPGMDGIELAAKAKSCRPDIITMFITGFGAIAEDRRGDIDERSTVLSKPFHLSELTDQIREALDGRKNKHAKG